MGKKKKHNKPQEIPDPAVEPEIEPGSVPEAPSIREEEPVIKPEPEEPLPKEIPTS